MISGFYSIFKSPLKISAKKIENCRNFDERDFRAQGPKLPMATKSRILKLECSQATWTFIDHTSHCNCYREGQIDTTCSNRSDGCFWLISLLLPLDVWPMKIHVAWEHSSFEILDLVAIGSFGPRARKSRSSKFRQFLIFFAEIFRGLLKIV